jgi:hypothetical protein
VGGKVAGTVALNSPASLYPTESGGPSYSGTAFWAKLNRAWIKPGLSLTVRANAGQVSISEPVTVGAPNDFTMYTLLFYPFGLDEIAVPLSTTAAPDKATRDE